LLHDFSQQFPLAYGNSLSPGVIKQTPDDFIVDEELSFPLTGSGEHIYLRIRKRLSNTQWVVKQLARHFGVQARDIGFAGLKDRQAVTTQWFSLPAKHFTDAGAAAFSCAEYEIIEINRHQGKLRRGAIRQNNFTICVREIVCEAQMLSQRLSMIVREGVPNYFGEQRFGIERNNLSAADDWCQRPRKLDRFKRGIYLSTMRSWLFNLVLAERIRQHGWCEPLSGDVYFLEGSKRFFREDKLTDELRERVATGDIHPSAPLWGEGEALTNADALVLEETVLADWKDWRACLERTGLKQERRALRVMPRELNHEFIEEKNELVLRFALPAGCYATGLLREIVTASCGELELTDE
jgi:tRNA pseudouridine13 synthase